MTANVNKQSISAPFGEAFLGWVFPLAFIKYCVQMYILLTCLLTSKNTLNLDWCQVDPHERIASPFHYFIVSLLLSLSAVNQQLFLQRFLLECQSNCCLICDGPCLQCFIFLTSSLVIILKSNSINSSLFYDFCWMVFVLAQAHLGSRL